MKGRLSDIAAAVYLTRYPTAVAVRHRAGRAHLMDNGRPECGSPLASGVLGEFQLRVGMTPVRWCYSCIGNAIERMETDTKESDALRRADKEVLRARGAGPVPADGRLGGDAADRA